MNTITRRTALAVPVTLPLLPVSAYAESTDPAVNLYEEWRQAYRAFLFALTSQHDEPVIDAAENVERAIAVKLVETVPSSLAGLACQIAFMPYCFGQVNSDDDDWTEPGNYDFGNWLCDDREAALCRSMQTSIKQIAGVAS